MRASARERPRVDHPVDRPELYGLKGLQVTGTNGRQFDHFYRMPSVVGCQLLVVSCQWLVADSATGRESTGNTQRTTDHGQRTIRVNDHRKGCSTAECLEPNHHLKQTPAGLETVRRGIVGGYTRGVTPVPIPNTAVKPAGPMILLQRESRSPPALNKETPIIAR